MKLFGNWKLEIENSRPKVFGRAGFTLIETMVALSIFSVSIVGLIVMTSQSIATTGFSKNRLIASYLAQEGIEVVRNVRDSAGPNGWVNFLGDFQSSSIGQCGNNSDGIDCQLYYDESSGGYGYSGTITPFTRTIEVVEIQPSVEVKITSEVSWQQGQATKTVTYSENLFNW